MRSIRRIKDIPDWGLCVGCGACFAHCGRQAVSMRRLESSGFRPVIDDGICAECTECLAFCPGRQVIGRTLPPGQKPADDHARIIGPTIRIWEGFATDTEIRFRASSGGAVTALALFCLEKLRMELVVHTGMDPEAPWRSKTVISRNRGDLVKNSGSRYQASSPCDGLRTIEESPRPCVFVGRPCDAAAVSLLRAVRPKLDAKLGLVLSFFCAGTPSEKATKDLLEKMRIRPDEVTDLRFRGSGWPGGFAVKTEDDRKNGFITYKESWSFLNHYRPFRCQICPDGLAECADISCGDAWHRYREGTDNPGLSLILSRSSHGDEIVQKAVEAGYLSVTPSTSSDVLAAQELARGRKLVWGRQLAQRMLLVPTTSFKNFWLLYNWIKHASLEAKIRSVVGTLRRVLVRGLWHKNRVS